jgi:hypothetical protein
MIRPPIRRVETPHDVDHGSCPLLVLIHELDLVRLGEVLAEVVRSAGLQRLAVAHEGLDRIRARGARELLGVALRAEVHGHGEHVLGDLAVHLEDVERLLLRFVGGGVRVWPSCQRNSVVRRNGRVTFSQRTTLHHWLRSIGRSRHDFTHFAYIEQIMASEVGRIASGSSSSSPPPMVTQAHSGEKPSTCSFSFSRKLFRNEQREVGVLVTEGLDAAVGFRLQVPRWRSRRGG